VRLYELFKGFLGGRGSIPVRMDMQGTLSKCPLDFGG
jgi:hypothetical protein